MMWKLQISSMNWQPAIILEPSIPIGTAYEVMDRAGCDGALVVEGGKTACVDYWSLRDDLRHGANPEMPVGETAVLCPFHLNETTDSFRALEEMKAHSLTVAPIWSEGRISAIVSVNIIRKGLRAQLRKQMREQGGVTFAHDPLFNKTAHRRKSSR